MSTFEYEIRSRNKRMNHVRSWPLLGMLCVATVAARTDAFVPDATPPQPASVRDPAPWREAELRLPGWPRDADLIPLRLDAPQARFRYFVDARSLVTAADGSVRYTLVAIAPNGTRNVAYEGLLCTPRGEYKIFAYGLEGRFEPLVESDWRPLERAEVDPQRYKLWRYYLCVPRRFAPRSPAEQLRLLRNGRVPEAGSDGLLRD